VTDSTQGSASTLLNCAGMIVFFKFEIMRLSEKVCVSKLIGKLCAKKRKIKNSEALQGSFVAESAAAKVVLLCVLSSLMTIGWMFGSYDWRWAATWQ